MPKNVDVHVVLDNGQETVHQLRYGDTVNNLLPMIRTTNGDTVTKIYNIHEKELPRTMPFRGTTYVKAHETK